MKVRGRGQHPQAQRHRQQDAEASLQVARQEWRGWQAHDSKRSATNSDGTISHCIPDGSPSDIPGGSVFGVLAEGLTAVLTWHSTRRYSAYFFMIGHRKHPVLRERRLINWAAVVAVVALAAWLVEFATHLHIPDEVQASSQVSHYCDLCAAFQAGASVSNAPPVVPKLRPTFAAVSGFLPAPRPQSAHSYRSRAPPQA